MKRPGTVTLRPARLAEAREMAELSRDLIETGLNWRYTPPRMAALMGQPETAALVACDGGQIEGFAVMQFGDLDAHLALLCVRPARQRRGMGRQLHEWLLESAQVAGIVSINLELRADNDAALAFYRCLGFVETQCVPGYYDGQITARRMQLPLRAAAA